MSKIFGRGGEKNNKIIIKTCVDVGERESYPIILQVHCNIL